MQDINSMILNTAHALIAGTTGSGKSTALHALIYYIMQTQPPSRVSLILIDLKRVELCIYKNVQHVLKYANTTPEAIQTLKQCETFMRNRYKDMEATGSTRSNKTHVYIIIDELADLLATSKQASEIIASIGRLGRAANIHLILATQSPSRKTLPAIIQQNITLTIALKCKTAIESRQVIGIAGAEELKRCGDCLIWNGAEGYSAGHINMVKSEAIMQAIKNNDRRH